MILRPVAVDPVKAILAIRATAPAHRPPRRQAVDDVQNARRQQVGDQFHQNHDRGRGLLGRLHHDAVARRQRRGQLPRRHQDREVPRDDLADDAQRLVEVIGDRVVSISDIVPSWPRRTPAK
jgi:hypothetical protein